MKMEKMTIVPPGPSSLQMAWKLWLFKIRNALTYPRNTLLEEEHKAIESAQQLLKDAQDGLKREIWNLGGECRFQSNVVNLIQRVFPDISEEKIGEELGRLNEIISKLIQNPESPISGDEKKEVREFFEKVAIEGIRNKDGHEIKWRLEELGYLPFIRH